MKIFLIFLAAFTSTFALRAQQTVSLNSGWTFQELNKPELLPAMVPGSVQRSLLNLKKIPDPFLGINENAVQWIEEKDWQFNRTLLVTPAMLECNRLNLVFEGLDTYATVYVNDVKVLAADNMFRSWRVNIRPYVRSGKNTLRIVFTSVTRTARPIAQALPFQYPADNEVGNLKMSPLVRKPGFQFGWDFAPRMLTVGIWKPVYLELVNSASILDIQINWKPPTQQLAEGFFNLELTRDRTESLLLTIRNQQTGLVTRTTIPAGTDSVVAGKLQIRQPLLWWPNGMGKPNLYRFKFTVSRNGHTLSEKEITTGVRTIEVVNQPDQVGESFFLKVNGKPVFVKGANWVPVSSLSGPDDDRMRKQLFATMKESHFNMVRVWGGGLYENDAFFELADRNGILVWQDFPFSCTMYPADANFLKSVKAEAIDNIKRLRNHASLALWCGNNEISVGWKNWGWQQKYGYSDTYSDQLLKGYKQLFEKLLPGLVKQYDKGRFYFPSSPISNWGTQKEMKTGDNHYWGVYHGELPFSAYETHVPRFNSEFGFQSFPGWNLLQLITQQQNPDLNGQILQARQKSYKGNALLKKYMDWYYPEPRDAYAFVFQSQLVQAEGMKIAIEAARRNKPVSMGTLVWQLNDVWPAVSWSTVNYDGQWKAAQFFLKRAYAPRIISVTSLNDSIQVFPISDKGSVYGSKIVIRKWNVNGGNKLVWQGTVDVQEQTVRPVTVPTSYLAISDRATEFLTIDWMQGDQLLATQNYYFNAPKEMNLSSPKLMSSFKRQGSRIFLTLKANRFVKGIYLSILGAKAHFTDNYFDMLPGKLYQVEVITDSEFPLLRNNLRMDWVKNQMK